MARIVMKFGGTSMAGIERIRAVAKRVKREVETGNEVAVVVSAMAGETDRLVQFCRDSATLGRGGSDTSAVAVAAALGADRCDIYTDVAGVYTTDPRIVPRARKLSHVSYEEMLELASVGAKVLQTRSVGLAMRHRLPIMVLSSFEDAEGTLIAGEEVIGKARMEDQVITGIAYDRHEAKITLTGLPDTPGAVAAIFGPLAEAGISVDMIVQSAGIVTFTVNDGELARALDIIEGAKGEIGYQALDRDPAVCKLSVVGLGIKSHAGAAATLFRTLAERDIAILAVSTSEIRVSVLIPEDATELAVRVLHTAYGLDAEEARRSRASTASLAPDRDLVALAPPPAARVPLPTAARQGGFLR
ncbi:MAG: aspartate kinase [Sphingomonadales bacterium]|nr:aspartate kinase [Sphingomonadales bacterium]